jgi:transcriptional regulator with XRE-family HTH domain
MLVLLKKYREKKGISQAKLSKLAGITLQTITKIESGATFDPRIETVKKIANALRISVDDLIGILVDLLTMYINDKNSSTIREFITVTLAGYKDKQGKIGYNGFRQDAIIPGRTIKCEAKPKNIDTEEFEKYKRGERKTSPAKLNGGGNFTDYTPNRLEKDKKEKDLNVLVSGFIDGKLIYIIEFPFNCPDFIANLEKQILRSATFDYKHFINCPKLKIVFLLNKKELSKYKTYIADGFYEFLMKMAK